MHSSTEGVSTDPVPGHFYYSANYTWQTCWPTQQAMAPTITTNRMILSLQYDSGKIGKTTRFIRRHLINKIWLFLTQI